ncbi:MAG: hypothetical protein LBD75_06410 [Candidatus Peribacteria bacterium]|nr:hypothetical protein [Candidatus Peribacteria bacterium]
MKADIKEKYRRDTDNENSLAFLVKINNYRSALFSFSLMALTFDEKALQALYIMEKTNDNLFLT